MLYYSIQVIFFQVYLINKGFLYIIILVINLYSIKENSCYQIEIKNSKFIGCLFKINNKDDVSKMLEFVKSNYKDATHYCYAYILEDSQKASDDGEPGGTAGMPILNVLQSNNLINVLAVVIRYFGGIKLGAGGLVRAYSKCVKETLDHSEIISLEKGKNIDVYFKYENIKEIDYLLKNEIINEKEYNELIKYNVNISQEKLLEIKDLIVNYQVIKDIYIEKHL